MEHWWQWCDFHASNEYCSLIFGFGEVGEIGGVQDILNEFLERDLEGGDNKVLDKVDDEVVELIDKEVEDVEVAVNYSFDLTQVNNGKAQQKRAGTRLSGLDNFEGDSNGFHVEVDSERWAEVHELGRGLVASNEVIDANGRADGDVGGVGVHRSQSSSVESGESLQVSIVDLGRASDRHQKDFLREFVGFDWENQRVQTIVLDANAKILQDFIGVVVGVSAVDVDDVSDAGADGGQSGRQNQSKSQGIHFYDFF